MTQGHVLRAKPAAPWPVLLFLLCLGVAGQTTSAAAMPAAPRAGVPQERPDVLKVADLGGHPAPHRNVYQVAPGGDKDKDWDDAAWDQIFREADGAFNTAVIDPRRKDFYRQDYFYGGTPYTGRKFYGAPVYYGGPYYTYYIHE